MLRRTLLAVPATLLIALSPVQAEERGSKEEAIAMVNAAFDHIKSVGMEKACDDFTRNKAQWSKKDLYVFIFDTEGVFKAHGANEKLVGRNAANLRDANGKGIFPAMMETSLKGTGWVDYDWAHPQTKKVEGKSSYIRKAPDGKSLIGVGIYR